MTVYKSCVQSFESLDGLVGFESLEPLGCLIPIAIYPNALKYKEWNDVYNIPNLSNDIKI